MNHPLIDTPENSNVLLLSNEAIVRGALEAGVNVISCYPGTPSSEVPDTFYRLKSCGRFNFEYSTNEKVALEVAAGASLAGALSFVTMKHVGLNVAADPLFTVCYTGTPGGLVVLSADDPLCHSSQNEQDNRYYARAASMPCFEPSNADEAKNMTKDALLLSRKLEQPVLLRTTTRVNHLRSQVRFGALANPAEILDVAKDPKRFVPVPSVAFPRHKELVKKMELAKEEAENSKWNTISGQAKLGIIVSGISRNYLSDVLLANDWNDKFSVLELGMSYPMPEKMIAKFLKSCDKVLILEELEPLVERDVRVIAQKQAITTKIMGKDDNLTIFGEYNCQKIHIALATMLGQELPVSPKLAPLTLAQRPPNLCAGCSHRSVYYAVRQTIGDDATYSSDIGCYTLGMLPPLKMADFLVCMGSSISAGSGYALASKKLVVAFLGDSTFFHSGMTGLANAVFNKHNLIVVVLDNGTTAMTGHQANPGMDQDILGADCQHLDIESIVRGIGVTQVVKVKANNLKKMQQSLEDMRKLSGVRVIISEEPCALFARRTLKKSKPNVAQVVKQSPELLACFEKLACPAFQIIEGVASIDEGQCSGCMFCLQLSKDIQAKK